jgi:hypothetical protein
MQGQANYATFTQQLVTKYQTLPCTTPADCIVVAVSSACAGACQIFAVPSSESESFRNTLTNAAQADCTTCPASPGNPCVAPAPMCIDAHCSFPPAPAP